MDLRDLSTSISGVSFYAYNCISGCYLSVYLEISKNAPRTVRLKIEIIDITKIIDTRVSTNVMYYTNLSVLC